MSKATLNMVMKILQNRLREEDFRIRLIHPGWVRTDMGGQQAHLYVRESAEQVAQQIMSSKKVYEALYIDWKGLELQW